MDRSRLEGGLRITVGNDVYYERGRSPVRRSPGGDLRNRLGPRPPEYGTRIPDQRHENFHNKPQQLMEENHGWTAREEERYRWSPQRDRRSPRHRSPGHHPLDRMSPPRRNYDRDMHHTSPSPQRRRNEIYPEERSPSYHSGRSSSRKASPPRHSQRSRSSSSPDSPRGRSRRDNTNWDDRVLPNVPSLREADDLLLAMYSKSEVEERPYKRSSSERKTNRDGKSESGSKAYINPAIVTDGQKLSAFTQAYAKTSPQKKQYSQQDIDDEDQFLYGNDVPRRQKKPVPYEHKPEPAPDVKKNLQPCEKKPEVTPGGFDTNALKNVLKAIGFDFEMSAQSLNKSGKLVEKVKTDRKTVVETKKETRKRETSPEKPPEPEPQKEVRKPAAIPVVATSQPLQQTNPNHMYQQAYNQAIQYQAGSFTAPQMQGQPMLVYQTPAGLVQVPHVAVPAMNQTIKPEPPRPNLKVVPMQMMEKKEKHENRKSPKELEQEKKARKRRLDYLEEELEKLRKQQSDLIKRKRKQKGDHELMSQNTLLQAGVERQIQEIRDAADKAAAVKSESSSESDSSDSEDEKPSFNYVDKGFHICGLCNITFDLLNDYLAHLLSKAHRKLEDPDNRPWLNKKQKANKSMSKNVINVPLKGVEFIFPIHGFYCSVCKVYSGDKEEGEKHCFSHEHNLAYAKFLKKNPLYEKPTMQNIKIEKSRAVKEERWEEKKIHIKNDVHASSFQRDNIQDQVRKKDQHRRNFENGQGHHIMTAGDKRKFERRSPEEIRPVPPQHLRRSPRESPSHRAPVSRYSRSPPQNRERYRDEKAERRFEERSPIRKRVREEKKRWSPGYDQYEKEREQQPEPEPPKPTIKFTKFTWKRTDKKDPPKEVPAVVREEPKVQKIEDKTKLTMKLKPKPQPFLNIGKASKTKSVLSGKIANFAPTTKVNTKTPTTGSRFGTLNRANMSVSTFLAASKKSVPAVPPSKTPVVKPAPPVDPPPPEPRPPSCLVDVKKAKKEPPPPGTEDNFGNDDAAVESDASGISMELASDED
uniref:Zinc finger protein n=2 Tax=Ciona intestinalis TaxID=7719 RepID=F6PZL2_CIOIN|nr:zinc finger protein isoform X1 [Ciona intestinalis]XP_026692026.1 zinc finger protein isoform X1 [Ciona intestinalis]XP_026692027.1 zinc finger protein isoform X1 [Ciona intestinalis]|eukprot:XP_026692025.1 zinc finger protein isoform X1 [Ciona intestinalis]